MRNQRMIDDFTLQTPKGLPVSFSSFRGKYVVVHFWASWCKPCIESFYAFKKIYTKYEGENFDMYSISIDLSKRAWLQAVHETQLPWLQAIDDKDINEIVFNITAIPAIYLIDPEGRTVMENFTLETGGEFDLKMRQMTLT